MKLAILGSPLGHSLSPAMQRAALDHVGISGDYVRREVDDAGLLHAVEDLREGHLDGANVTMPHKQAAFALCDEHSATAGRIGAVNTLSIDDGRLVGANTDAAGIEFAWRVGQLPTEEPVLILGSGGAAAAALAATRGRPQYVVARHRDAALSMVVRLGATAVVVEWGQEIPRGVVINATPLGMRGEALPEAVEEVALGLLDMPYRDTPTPAVASFTRRQLPVADGLDMLVGQAVESFRIWTGLEVDAAVFRDAAKRELERRRDESSSDKGGGNVDR